MLALWGVDAERGCLPCVSQCSGVLGSVCVCICSCVNCLCAGNDAKQKLIEIGKQQSFTHIQTHTPMPIGNHRKANVHTK